MTIDEHHKLDCWLLLVQWAMVDYPMPTLHKAKFIVLAQAAECSAADLPEPGCDMGDAALLFVGSRLPDTERLIEERVKKMEGEMAEWKAARP
jgi:hypothetical protein